MARPAWLPPITTTSRSSTPSPLAPARSSSRAVIGPLPAPGRRWSRTSFLAMEGNSHQQCAGEDSGGDPVDGGAERWPPARVPDEVRAVLPQILQAVAGQPEHEQPCRFGDTHRGHDYENSGHAALDGDDFPASIGHAEPDVDRRDEDEPERVDGPGL